MARAPISYTLYIAGKPETVWEGFVSPEANRTIFLGADFHADLRPGGSMVWSGPGPDGKPTTYVRGRVLQSEPPRLLRYIFAMGESGTESRVTVELTGETEATRLTVTHDEWADDDPNYMGCIEGWPRTLSRLKTLLETGKTFKPH